MGQQMAEDIKVVTDKDYAQSKVLVERQQNKVCQTIGEIKKDFDSQKQSFEQRLGERKARKSMDLKKE